VPSPTARSSPDAQGTDGAPDIAVTAPVNGATIRAGAVRVTVAVSGFELVKRLGAPAREGQGHIVYYRDATQIPTLPDATARTPGSSHASAKRMYTWRGVDPGPHTFAVQLVNNDDTPLNPPITAETTVTVGTS
jgi:hypothetical protein